MPVCGLAQTHNEETLMADDHGSTNLPIPDQPFQGPLVFDA